MKLIEVIINEMNNVSKNQKKFFCHKRIVEDIAIYSQQLLLTSDDSEDRTKMYKEFLDMFEPQGIMNIALKIDANL